MTMITKCPLCKGEIEVNGDPNIGSQVKCLHCYSDFEVTWLYPLTLDYCDDYSSIYHNLACDEDQPSLDYEKE